MNIFNKVTLQSLRKNKTRTLVTIIGIMLSAAMICAVTTLVSSVYNYALEYAIYNNGDWHGSALNTDIDTYKKINSSDEIKRAVYCQHMGYAIAEGCTNEYKPYLFILGAGKGFDSIMPIHITSGRYPASSDEIILPNHLAENGEVRHSIGDVLTLEIGDRVDDDYVLSQENPFICDDSGEEIIPLEELKIRETKTYTVVGFYERPGFESYTAPGYTAITLEDPAISSNNYDVYFKIKNAKDIYDFMTESNLSGSINSSVLTYSGVTNLGSFDTMVIGLSAIVIGLIIFGSVSLIYNAFSISVSERTKQFGLLSSIGATKKQLRRMVFFEALVVSAIGIPLGIIAGIGGIGVTLLFIGSKFEVVLDLPIPLRVNTSPLYVLAAIIIALVTVLISVWIPSKRATKVSAVQAIRQNLDINAKGKPVKTSKLMYKLFGLPGMLANKYYKRSRKKYRATIVSLFMSIVLFVSATAFTDYMLEMAEEGFNTHDYDLNYSTSGNGFENISKEELLNLLKDDEGVTAASYVTKHSYGTTINKNLLSNQAIKYSHHFTWSIDEASDIVGINIGLCFVDDASFKDILREYNLDEEKFYNPSSPLAIALNSDTIYDSAEEKYVKLNMLGSDTGEINIQVMNDIMLNPSDTSSETDVTYDTVTLKYGATLEDSPYFANSLYGNGLTFIYPDSFMKELFPDMIYSDSACTYFFKSENHTASYNAIRQTLNENGFSRNGLYDYAARVEEERNMVTIIQTFAYGFIVLISLIAAANVFNTISTNISLRRREFAMLKSVGMTAKGLNRMMNFECLLYGAKSLLYGLPVSIGITFLIYIIVSEGYMFGFKLPLMSICIAILSVFLVVFATMMYSMSKIKKENPIDALKNENI